MAKRCTERALGYVRVSTQRKAESGIGLANQEKRLAAHYRQREIELVEIYQDFGLSGRTDNRLGLQALFEHALHPGSGITEIGVYSFSRLFRNNSRLEHHQRQLEHAGVRLVAIRDEVGTANNGSSSMPISVRDGAVAGPVADTFGVSRPCSDRASS